MLIVGIVIITSFSDKKLELAKSLGADKTINYRPTPDQDVEVLKLTNDEGADIVFENGGAQALRKSFDCVFFGGLINCIGYLLEKEDLVGGFSANVCDEGENKFCVFNQGRAISTPTFPFFVIHL